MKYNSATLRVTYDSRIFDKSAANRVPVDYISNRLRIILSVSSHMPTVPSCAVVCTNLPVPGEQ